MSVDDVPQPPFPPKGKFIDYVRTSSRELREASGIKIDKAAVDSFLLSLDQDSFRELSKQHGLSLPLRFASPLAELNVLSLIALLNMGSGYRSVLHRVRGRGAWDTMLSFVLGLYLSDTGSGTGSMLSAEGMRVIRREQVAELMRLPLHIEEAHVSIPGLTVGMPGGEAAELVDLVTNTLNEAGEALKKGGYKDLGTLVAEGCMEGERRRRELEAAGEEGDKAHADAVVERVVKVVPGFRDMALVDGHATYIFKKAFFLVQAIHMRLGSTSSSASIPVPDSRPLPMFVDNVIPTMLVHLGILDLSSACSTGLREAGARIGKRSEGSVRAAEQAEAERKAEEEEKEQQRPRPRAEKGLLYDVEEGPHLSHADAFRLRAAALDAGATLAARARELSEEEEGKGWMKAVNEVDLDGYVWSVAKRDAELRRVPRVVEKMTAYY